MVVKFSKATFNKPGRRPAIVSDTLAFNFQPNGRPYGKKCQLIPPAKSNKKLQNGDKTVTKCYKMITNCEIFNNCAK